MSQRGFAGVERTQKKTRRNLFVQVIQGIYILTERKNNKSKSDIYFNDKGGKCGD